MKNQTTTRRVVGARTAHAGNQLIGDSAVSLNSAAHVLAFFEHAMGQVKAALPVKIGGREIRTMGEFRALVKTRKNRRLAAMHKADAAYRRQKSASEFSTAISTI